MTREELKKHCKKTVEQCEMWAIHRGEEPSGKVYEEHKAILDILEQQTCKDAINRADAIDQMEQSYNILDATDRIKALPPVTPSRRKGH